MSKGKRADSKIGNCTGILSNIRCVESFLARGPPERSNLRTCACQARLAAHSGCVPESQATLQEPAAEALTLDDTEYRVSGLVQNYTSGQFFSKRPPPNLSAPALPVKQAKRHVYPQR
jgi:hypothetical protein